MPSINFDRIKPRQLKYTDDFSDFHCDHEDDLGCDSFIHNENEAKQYQKERHGITYIFSYCDKMIGYATLAMSSILAKRLDKKDNITIHLSFYPCLLIGRLAVDNDMRHRNIGTYLAEWSTGVALELSERVGCRYVVLETSENKVAFYSQCGFQKGAVLEDDRHVWMYKKIASE